MLSKKPRNRRRRVRRKSNAETAWMVDEPTSRRSAKKRSSQPSDQVHQLNAQIGAIENFLASHHQAEAKKLQMKRENILPPPDRSAQNRRNKKQMSLAAKRRYFAERNRSGLHFLFLFLLACGLGWWLIFSGV